MQDAQNNATSNEYRSVPISILVESATNPRKRFDEKNLEELAASMKAQGILAPLLVRELEESKYEVVAGARRLRAAKLAELETVPVRVVKLTDAESIEAQVVENLQREDIHPLEESLGFKSLLQFGEPTYNIASIAARAPQQKPCQKMTEAVVMDGGRRGELVKVCADPSCRVHHPDTPSSEQVAKERAEERKRIEKEKLAITTRHRVLATILQRVSAPLKKADLLAVAHYLIGHLSYSQVPNLAKRHKVEVKVKKDSASAQELLVKQVVGFDESELSKLLLEVSLLDSAYQRSTSGRDDVLMDAAKRYRVDIEKLQKAVAKEFAAKQDKRTIKPKGKTAA